MAPLDGNPDSHNEATKTPVEKPAEPGGAPVSRLFKLVRNPERMIVMDEQTRFKECHRKLVGKLEEFKSRRPAIEQLPLNDHRRQVFECKSAIIAELWGKGRVSLDNFGKTDYKPDRYDPVVLLEAFNEIIFNELEVDY